jgi:hypothetical protein
MPEPMTQVASAKVRRYNVAAVKPRSFKFELWDWLNERAYRQYQPCVADQFVLAADHDAVVAELRAQVAKYEDAPDMSGAMACTNAELIALREQVAELTQERDASREVRDMHARDCADWRIRALSSEQRASLLLDVCQAMWEGLVKPSRNGPLPHEAVEKARAVLFPADAAIDAALSTNPQGETK